MKLRVEFTDGSETTDMEVDTWGFSSGEGLLIIDFPDGSVEYYLTANIRRITSSSNPVEKDIRTGGRGRLM